MTKPLDQLRTTTRRHFFERCGVGLGAIALGSLLGEPQAEANPLAPRAPHFPPKRNR
jgi:hypothetical protein